MSDPIATEENTLQIKTPTSLVFEMQYTADGNPENGESLADMGIYIAFKDPRTQRVLKEVSVDDGITITDEENGVWECNGGSSEGFPLGLMPIDIQYSKNGTIQMTETFFMDFSKGISDKVS